MIDFLGLAGSRYSDDRDDHIELLTQVSKSTNKPSWFLATPRPNGLSNYPHRGFLSERFDRMMRERLLDFPVVQQWAKKEAERLATLRNAEPTTPGSGRTKQVTGAPMWFDAGVVIFI